MMKKPKTDIDFKPTIEKMRRDAIMNAALYISYKLNLKLQEGDIVFQREKVGNYSVGVYTCRYKGQLWFRVFNKGVTMYEGIRIESPFL